MDSSNNSADVSENEKKAIEKIKKRFKDSPFNRYLETKLVEIKPGFARVTMEITPKFLNGAGITHGGVIFSLADSTFGSAVNAYGIEAVSSGFVIHYLKTTGVGDVLTCTAREEYLTRRTGIYRVEIRNGNNELVAIAEAHAYRLSDSNSSGSDTN